MRRAAKIAMPALQVVIVLCFLLRAQSPQRQSAATLALSRSAGCLSCHNGIEDIHNGKVPLACIDCHGGNESATAPAGASKNSPEWLKAKRRAHVAPRFPEKWPSSANPERSYTLLNRESREFIRFINPGDLRVADQNCGNSECHSSEAHNVSRSMMTTGAMLWGAALYNNGAYRIKNYRYGESYDSAGHARE